MLKRNVWTVLDTEILPKNPIGILCVFKVKDDGRYKDRLVSFSFFKIPGFNFFESHDPVLSDMSIRVLLMMKLLHPSWEIHQLDVEEEFIEGKLDQELYIKLPKVI